MVNESGLEAIISVFIRCSELSAVKYDVASDTLKLEAALNAGVDEQERHKFIRHCTQSMSLYYRITGLEPEEFNLNFIVNSGITIIRLYRDSKTLSEKEMEIFVSLLRQTFASRLIRDDNDIAAFVDSSSAVKRTLLSKIKQSSDKYQNIFAYREKGKVFVFNK